MHSFTLTKNRQPWRPLILLGAIFVFPLLDARLCHLDAVRIHVIFGCGFELNEMNKMNDVNEMNELNEMNEINEMDEVN